MASSSSTAAASLLLSLALGLLGGLLVAPGSAVPLSPPPHPEDVGTAQVVRSKVLPQAAGEVFDYMNDSKDPDMLPEPSLSGVSMCCAIRLLPMAGRCPLLTCARARVCAFVVAPDLPTDSNLSPTSNAPYNPASPERVANGGIIGRSSQLEGSLVSHDCVALSPAQYRHRI